MLKIRKTIILLIIFIMLAVPLKAQASTASTIADKTIEFTSKTAYYVTKYTLKTGWFLTRKTAKGIKIVSTSVFNAARDTFKPNNKPGPQNKYTPTRYDQNIYNDQELPPPPPIL